VAERIPSILTEGENTCASSHLKSHFATPLFLDGPGQDLKKAALKFEGRAMKLIEPLCDIGDKRLAAMDAAGIDFQMLSLTSPGTEQLDAGDAIALVSPRCRL
jgi:hypothetical protein